MRIPTLAYLTVLEVQRRKLLWIVLALSAIFLLLFGVGFYFVNRDIVRQVRSTTDLFEARNIFLIIGLYGVNFLVVVLAILTSADIIAGEIGSGVIQTMVTKPLGRWEIVLGKWLGLASMLGVFVLAMGFGLMGIVYAVSGYFPPYPWQGLGLIILEGWLVLSLSVLGGTRLATLANGVVLFMLYALAFIGSWIEQFGAFARNDAMVNIGIVVSLLIPSEAMWKRAAYLMQPPFLRELGLSPFGTASAPNQTMVYYAVGYMTVAVILALWSFSRRDL
jgi:ABC-type transport system involved in multi-copper enzyme maturation permease subunit